MSTRHHAREVALQILYRYDIAKSERPDENKVTDASTLTRELQEHYEHFSISASQREFISTLVAGTILERDGLDEILERHTSNWKINRMTYVDRSLLRMAVYEMKNFPDIPVSVVIDEAIELGKQFGSAETPAFVNGILDAVKGSIRAV